MWQGKWLTENNNISKTKWPHITSRYCWRPNSFTSWTAETFPDTVEQVVLCRQHIPSVRSHLLHRDRSCVQPVHNYNDQCTCTTEYQPKDKTNITRNAFSRQQIPSNRPHNRAPLIYLRSQNSGQWVSKNNFKIISSDDNLFEQFKLTIHNTRPAATMVLK